MKDLFADRMSKVPRSFVREILKVTEDSDIISFGGGLPNPKSFPHKEIAEVASEVLKYESSEALQYSTTEGYKPLREYIAQRYLKNGLKVDADEILITNGSQQGLDLVGKVFLNRDDGVIVERPTYLAAIQAFGMYEPKFHSVKLMDDGPDTPALEKLLKNGDSKIFYCVPNFQNPSGISYSEEKRKEVAGIIQENNAVLVEDNPYGEIRFMGRNLPPIKKFLPDSVLLGSFSKIVAPGIRLGWVVAGEEVMDKLVTAKQASDLHSNYLAQRMVHRFLTEYDVEKHLNKIRSMYRMQRDVMVNSIEEYFPEGVTCTKPEGGMFLWVTLPEGVSSMELFDLAIKENVAFVPGEAFYADDPEINTMRLNFSNSDEKSIVEGIKRLSNALEKIL
ncbi:aminotransferase-like domain-containing protein [Methanobacterium congolense]|uniref:Aromatic-amino-acid aminotransferase 1 n=1 Tax=Methanobacterium congolense TaxID=118062 RepID=A0A1D3L385_9EURY|nr:PLP-dependent aminotransferase family protein [Methanobacterium congolense]SCG86028.1 Aromatic-amino-acid aminotransferase 1 [Methanobacterium congolense]